MMNGYSESCRFCLANNLLVDEPILKLEQFFLLGSIDLNRPHQAMIVPYRHIETPFELNAIEWAELGAALAAAKAHLSASNPSGFTIGWNVGAVAGQEVFHAHLHLIARFDDEPSQGIGIHGLFRREMS